MQPLERAKRAVRQWDYHWSISAATNVLFMNIKREIEEATQEEREVCAALAESIGYAVHDSAPDPQEDNSDRAGEKIAAAIRARGAS